MADMSKARAKAEREACGPESVAEIFAESLLLF
jgi:hypothetical protein